MRGQPFLEALEGVRGFSLLEELLEGEGGDRQTRGGRLFD
jgi:hypothetical protein